MRRDLLLESNSLFLLLSLDPELSFFFEVRWLQAAARGKKTRLMTVMLDTKPLIVKMYYMTSSKSLLQKDCFLNEANHVLVSF